MKTILALLAVLALAGCAAAPTAVQRAMYINLCRSQCPIAKSLAMRACSEIDAEKEPVLYDVCASEVEAVYAACPNACYAAFPEPAPEPESEQPASEQTSE